VAVEVSASVPLAAKARLIARCTDPRPLAGGRGRLRKLEWCAHFIGSASRRHFDRTACNFYSLCVGCRTKGNSRDVKLAQYREGGEGGATECLCTRQSFRSPSSSASLRRATSNPVAGHAPCSWRWTTNSP